jgi:hypothetical protein
MPVLTPRVFAGFFLGCGMFHLCGVGADILREMAGDKDKAMGLAKQSLIDYINGEMINPWPLLDKKNRGHALVCNTMCIAAIEAQSEYLRLLLSAQPGGDLSLSNDYLEGVKREASSIGEYALNIDRDEALRWVEFGGIRKKKKTGADFGVERRILKAAFAVVDARSRDDDLFDVAIAARDAAIGYMKRHKVKKEIQIARIVAVALECSLYALDLDDCHPYGGLSDFGFAMYAMGVADAAKK